jgi:hypothetical protein
LCKRSFVIRHLRLSDIGTKPNINWIKFTEHLFMTLQIPENLIYEGEEYPIRGGDDLLQMYFSLVGIEPEFDDIVSSRWRGYQGTWEIIDDRLYLTELTCNKLTDGSTPKMKSFFPDSSGPVFAYWFSGDIRFPHGKVTRSRMGYEPDYEEDWYLIVEDGIVSRLDVVINELANLK